MSGGAQLALPFEHAPSYAPQTFFRFAGNEAALRLLERAADWPERRLIVWGEPGSGKTHLLHAWAHGAAARIWHGHRLDWTQAQAGTGPVAVDAADRAAEASLLHLLNCAAALGRTLVLTARCRPRAWPARLPDLRSRLRATEAVELRAPDDELLSPLFARLLAERQLAVPAQAQAWLLKRLPRHPAALAEAASRIDRALLARGGGLTWSLAKTIVGEPP